MRAALGLAVAVVLVAAAVTAAVLALFSTAAFTALRFDLVALEFVHGRLAPEDLEAMVIAEQRFTPAEIAHLVDVRALIGLVGRVFVAAAGLAALAAIAVPRAVRLAASLALAGVALVGGGVGLAYGMFGFVRVGVFFHRIVFPQGNWYFPIDSLMIRLYGQEVMVAGAAFVIVAAVGLIVVAWVLTRMIPARPREGAW
jgi:uncharacterized membrane protein